MRSTILKMAPLVLGYAALGAWFAAAESSGSYALRNLLPPAIVLVLAFVALRRGGGRFAGAGWQLPLGTIGYAIPAIGLSAYLHYAFAVNLNGMFGDPPAAGQLFRFLPIYTAGAGAIGFAIGWIAGRNL
jgi:hypothetical protein